VTPKPPAFVEHIVWFWKAWPKYKLVVLIGIVAISPPIIYGINNIITYTSNKEYQQKIDETNKFKSDKKEEFPALRIRFKDGEIGYVSYSVTIKLDPNNAAQVVSSYGDQKKAISELLGAVSSAAYAVLEANTITNVRQNRTAIENSIRELSTDAEKRTFHTIERININEIDSVR
jgi:hypothetical protein